MKSNSLILSCAYPSAGHLLTLISISMWLVKQGTNNISKNKVDLILLPNPKNLKFNQILDSLFKKFISFLPLTLNKKLQKVLRKLLIKNKGLRVKKISKILMKLENSLNDQLSRNKNSFYNSIFGKREVSFLQYKKCYLKIKLIYILLIKKIFFLICSIIEGSYLIISCFDNPLFFNKQKFLNLHYNKIHIGDLTAAYTIRINPKSAGQLKLSPILFINTVQSIYIIKLSNDLDIEGYDEVYIIPTEPWYIHQVWVRTLVKRDIKIIDIHTKDRNYTIRFNLEYLNDNWRVERIEANNNNFHQKVIEHLNEKLFNPNLIDTFLKSDFSNNNEEEDVYDDNNNKLTLTRDTLSVVIFSQNLEDALYDDGLDGFDDVYHWLTFSIDECLKNREINNIYIKLHPNIDQERYPSNYFALKKLKKKYGFINRVKFLKKNTSLIALSSNLKFYGITRCGTVVEEIVFLGQPMIGWANGPWRDNFNFIFKWNNIEEYCAIIRNLSIDKWQRPDRKEIDELFLYVNCQIEKNQSSENKQSIRLFLTDKLSGISKWDHIEYENIMSNMNNNSKIHNETIKLLYDEYLL